MKKTFPVEPIPSLAQRALEFRRLDWPGARISMSVRQLICSMEMAPGAYGRLYQCLLKITPDAAQPDVIVVGPDLNGLAHGRAIPHTYAYGGSGTRLCLWWPKGREWMPRMKLADTFIPWTGEWLHYFELWLKTGEWSGGGEHPVPVKRRWGK